MAQQCCPGGNRPETPRRPSAGGLRIFWAKSLVIPAIYTKFVSHKLEFCIYGWNYQWFSPKIRNLPVEGLRGVSGRFPLWQHCWVTRYILQTTDIEKESLTSLGMNYQIFDWAIDSNLKGKRYNSYTTFNVFLGRSTLQNRKFGRNIARGSNLNDSIWCRNECWLWLSSTLWLHWLPIKVWWITIIYTSLQNHAGILYPYDNR